MDLQKLTTLEVAHLIIVESFYIFKHLLIIFIIVGAFFLILKTFRNIVTGRYF